MRPTVACTCSESLFEWHCNGFERMRRKFAKKCEEAGGRVQWPLKCIHQTADQKTSNSSSLLQEAKDKVASVIKAILQSFIVFILLMLSIVFSIHKRASHKHCHLL